MKSNGILFIILTVIILIFAFLSLTGCTKTCDKPYKYINKVCCTDENENKVCDVDELPDKDALTDKEDATPALREADDSLYGEAEPLEMPDYNVSQELPEQAKTPEPKVLNPTIDKGYNIKETTVPSKPMPEAKPTIKEPEFSWEVSNLKYGFGLLNRFDIRIKNLEDEVLEPRVHIYAIQDGEYRRVQVVFLAPLWPDQERLFENMLINAELDPVDQDVKFEVVYHTREKGLVTVGAQEIPVLKRDIRS